MRNNFLLSNLLAFVVRNLSRLYTDVMLIYLLARLGRQFEFCLRVNFTSAYFIYEPNRLQLQNTLTTFLQWSKTPLTTRVLDMTLNHQMVRLQPWDFRNMEYPFIAIAARFTLTQSGSTWLDPIDGSNRTIWHLNYVQTNDVCQIEFHEIELFDHLNACKQMTGV